MRLRIGVNVPGNALAGGFDLAATFPRYLNIRRGAYLTAIFSIIVNPWRLVNTATTFLTVLSSYSVFLAPVTVLMISSYLVVNKRKIDVDDLYRGDSGSIYCGLVYVVLHRVFPAKALDSFVRTAPSARELQEFHLGKWDITLAETPDVVDVVPGHGGKTVETVTTKTAV
ncbi:hypothetical protein diail_10916 [Diaporthe ilicicola]|nr:hypothetical protein diail_10916 [Diaporthe ilicicola]